MPFRFYILFLGWLSLTSISSNVNVFNVARLCMNNGDETDPNAIFYTEHEYNSLIIASSIGTLLATLPFNWIYTQVGARLVFFCAGLISILSTVLIPICVEFGYKWLYAARFVQGIAYASDFACMGLICARWAPLKQSAFFISVLSCYTSLSTLISSPITGVLCSYNNWQWSFYLHCIGCAVLLLLWIYFYRDNPKESRFVSTVELEKISLNKSKSHLNMDKAVPYTKILTDPLILCIWTNAFFEIASGIFSLTYQPLFLKQVLKFDITKTGFLAVSGPVFHIPLKFIFGLCSDKITIFEEVNKMRLFNTIAVFLPGFCFLAISYIPVEFPWLHVTMFSLIGITFAAAGGGFYKCAALYSREHSSFVIANIQVVKALTMLLGPTLMNWLVEDVTQQSQWRLIFVPMALSVFISNCLFCWLVSDRPAKFTFSALEEAGKPSISNPQTSALNVQRHN